MYLKGRSGRGIHPGRNERCQILDKVLRRNYIGLPQPVALLRDGASERETELSDPRRNPGAAARRLRRRVGQTMQRLTGRAGLRLPGENEFLRDLGGRFGTFEESLEAAARDDRMFLAELPRERTASLFASVYPERRARIIARARQACAHRFDLLGSGPRELGPRLPWHADFSSGHTWDAGTPFDELRLRVGREFGQGHDVKIPWELSRFQHLPSLGQAFWLTGEPLFYRKFQDQVGDWIEENRPGYGINWTSTMDVAIRAVNWIWAYGFFRDEILADRKFASLMLRSLFTHGRFIAANLDNTGQVSNNHYFSNLVGLLFLGMLFRGAPEADGWKGLAIPEIEMETCRQTYEDGVGFEGAIAYHRLTTEMALTALLLMERGGFRLPVLRDRIRRMIEFIAHYLKPNGMAPQIGDNDDGRLQILGEYDADPLDHRALLATAGYAFEDDGWRAIAGDRWEEAFWFFGPDRVPRSAGEGTASRVRVTSRAHTEGGIAILRHDDLYAILDAGPVGMDGLGGHAHNDSLSIEIQAAGRDLLVDPGSGAYTRDLKLRDRLRSTAAHNTVRVDGEEINPLPDEPFSLPGVDSPMIRRFVSRQGFDLVEAEHRGYMRLRDPVLHRRVLLLNKRTRRFVFEDLLIGKSDHLLEWFFHLAPGCAAVVDADGRIARCRCGGVNFTIAPISAPGGMSATIEAGEHSPGYGRLQESRVIRFACRGEMPVTVRFALDLRRIDDQPNNRDDREGGSCADDGAGQSESI